MQVRVLGEVEAVTDGGPVRVGSRNQRIVLAVLAAQPGFAASADLLVDALWGYDPPASARATLRTYVSRLRRLLGGCVSIGPTGYALDLSCEEIDACRLEQLVDRAVAGLERSDPETAVALLDEALGLWRGVPFGDVGDLAAVRGAVARLEERRTAACEARSAALLAAGRTAEAIGAVEELVAQHPLRESAWAVLVEALADASRAPEALRAFQRASHALAEAGLEPSERLRKAEARVLARQEPEISPRALTVASSSLVGRDADVALVSRLLAEHRIVTLVGPGGVGKTRLALAVGAAVADRFEWGARLVELAGVADPQAVPAVVAQGLGLRAHGAPPEEVLANAGQLEMLGVIDNCEHVIDAAARAVEALGIGGSRVRLLVTSREPLGVEGERLWPVSPLATTVTPADESPGSATAPAGPTPWSGARSPAHLLFLDRARAVRPELDPDEREREAIDRITRRLDGLPLAIEMAASRVATLPLVELAVRLEDEVGTVVSRRRTSEPRHRTLAAVVEWSEKLLEPDERDLFADMAIFEGPVRVEDVVAVTGRAGSLDVLARLAERSLLVADVSGDRARFGMLRTIRDRARRLLADTGRAEHLSARHAEHIADALVQADLDLRRPDEADAHVRIEELLADARAAYGWASENDLELARRLCSALFLFGQSRCRDEVLGWSAALASRGGATLTGTGGALVLAARAQRAVNGGELTDAMSLAEQAADAASEQAETAGEPGALPHVHEIISDIHLYSGRLDEAARVADLGMVAARRADDPHGLVVNVLNKAMAAAYGRDHQRAEKILTEAPDNGSLAPSDRAWLLFGEGEVVLDRDPPGALAALDQAIALADSVGNRYVGGIARVSATSLRARAGDAAAALGPFAVVINHWRGQGNGPLQATTLRNLVVLLRRLGAAPEAAQLLGSLQGGSAPPTFGDEARRLEEAQAWTVEELGDVEAQSQFAAGAARTIEAAAVTALDWLATG